MLEQALDVSQIDELNQAASPRFKQAVQRLEQGALLLTARPETLGPWLGLPGEFTAPGVVQELVASLRPDNRSLELEALLQFAADAAVPVPSATGTTEIDPTGAVLLEALQGPQRAWP